MIGQKGRKSGFLLSAVMFVMTACASHDNFTQTLQTKFFTQGYNPEELDVLWMIDTRSPMHNIQSRLVSEASKFFTRLDQLTTSDYRMAFVSADMQFAKGALEPIDNPKILTKTLGTVQERAAYFGTVLGQTVNLTTGADDDGFQSVDNALNDYFVPRSDVPLVLVFISDSDDHSEGYGSSTDASDFAAKYLLLKENNADLLRVYSVNYTKNGDRCATEYNADIDSTDPARPFENTYFSLATLLKGSTADLCQSFADQIDLTGLKLKTLPLRFKLDTAADPKSVHVDVFDTTKHYTVSWSFDAATNEVVFVTAPPDGTTIQVTYLLARNHSAQPRDV